MQENNLFFVVFKKSMWKHIFETSNICFFNIKKQSKYVRVLAVCMKTHTHTHTHIYIYMSHCVENQVF